MNGDLQYTVPVSRLGFTHQHDYIIIYIVIHAYIHSYSVFIILNYPNGAVSRVLRY